MIGSSLRIAAIAAGFLAAIVFSGVSQAAQTGSVDLTGSVTLNCSLTVTQKAAATAMNLGVSSTNLLVASINENCKDKNGFVVTLTSNNGDLAGVNSGLLKGGSGNADTVAYTVKYDGATVNLVGGSAIVTNATHKTGGSGDDKNLTLSYTGAPSLNADTYTDTIILSLVGN